MINMLKFKRGQEGAGVEGVSTILKIVLLVLALVIMIYIMFFGGFENIKIVMGL